MAGSSHSNQGLYEPFGGVRMDAECCITPWSCVGRVAGVCMEFTMCPTRVVRTVGVCKHPTHGVRASCWREFNLCARRMVEAAM
jgi:hypothetical protein